MNNTDKLNKYLELQEDNPERFVERLAELAFSGNHTPVGLFNNINEYHTARILARAIKKVVKGFRKARKISYNQYLIKLKNNIEDLQALGNTRSSKICEDYFTIEYNNLIDKIEEFNFYMYDGGNLFPMLFGRERPYADMHDYRLK